MFQTLCFALAEDGDSEVPCMQDRSFTFILKTPPASKLLLKAIGKEKGSGTPNGAPIGTVTMAQLEVIGHSMS